MRFEYPIEGCTEEKFFNQNKIVGTYPIGRAFNWHGGIHVNENRNANINAIADGVIVAYRVGKTTLGDKIKYSNSFVLLLHRYKSPAGREFRFYSLYNHLMPYDQMMTSGGLPEIFKEDVFKVLDSVKDNGPYKGLKLRTFGATSNERKEVCIVPKGTVCELVEDDNTPEKFVAVNYTPLCGKTLKKHLLWVGDDPNSTKYVKIDKDNSTVTVMSNASSGKPKDTGLHLRRGGTSSSNDNIIGIIPKGTPIRLNPEDVNNEGWLRVIEVGDEKINGYVYHSEKDKSLKNTKVARVTEANFNKVVTGKDCNIAVKAGEIVGKSGACGFLKQETYRAAHIDVFTDEDPSDFLSGSEFMKDDTEDTKNFLKIEKGTELSLKYPYSFSAEDEIKVLDFPASKEKKYCRIKLHKQTRDVNKEDLKFKEKNKGDSLEWAKYKPDNLSNLNILFNDTLSKGSIIDWVESLENEGDKERRKVSYTLKGGEREYWVNKDLLKLKQAPVNPVFALKDDVTELFEREPKEEEIELGEDLIYKKSDLKAIKYNDDEWYHIKTLTPVENEHGYVQYQQVEGYVDKSDAEAVSAHNWESFGFNVCTDQSEDFIFDDWWGELSYGNAPTFLKNVWSLMDKNTDDDLTKAELVSGLKDQFVQKRMSRMVCYHQSEWGVKFEDIKSDIEAIYDKQIEGTENEAELNEEKKQKLALIEQRVNDYYFWDKVKVEKAERKTGTNRDEGMLPDWINEKLPDWVNYLGKEVLKFFEYEFPTDAKVYHFHPVAFVEQMRRMEDGNVVEVYLKERTILKVSESIGSNRFTYKVLSKKGGRIIETYNLEQDTKGDKKFLRFPEIGVNWDRYGSRDKGGDNWVNEKVAGYFLGLLYEIKSKDIIDTLFYDDISGYNGKNIGHKTHKKGEDIDIRYPGTNKTVRFWYQSTFYDSNKKDDSELVKKVEELLEVAANWKFTSNYVYKSGIKNGKYASNHEHHIHIGCRNY